MEKEVRVASVNAYQTKSGNMRFVLRDEEGNEYTTFKEEIARQAVAAEGKRARIEYHEQQRGEFTNVYLDTLRGSSERASPETRSLRKSSSRGSSRSRRRSPTTFAATARNSPFWTCLVPGTRHGSLG